jgi:hypothetical protein
MAEMGKNPSPLLSFLFLVLPQDWRCNASAALPNQPSNAIKRVDCDLRDCARIELSIGNHVSDAGNAGVKLGLRWHFEALNVNQYSCIEAHKCLSLALEDGQCPTIAQKTMSLNKKVRYCFSFEGREQQCTRSSTLQVSGPGIYPVRVSIELNDRPVRITELFYYIRCEQAWQMAYCFLDKAENTPKYEALGNQLHRFPSTLPLYLINLPHTDDVRGRRARRRYLHQIHQLQHHPSLHLLRVRGLLPGEPGTLCAGDGPGVSSSPHQWHRREAAITCTFLHGLSDIAIGMDSMAILCEDDAVFHPRFNAELQATLQQVPANFDVLHLGSRGIAELRLPTHKSDSDAGDSWESAAAAGSRGGKSTRSGTSSNIDTRRVLGMPWPGYPSGHAEFDEAHPFVPGQPLCALFSKRGAGRVAQVSRYTKCVKTNVAVDARLRCDNR